MSLRTVKKIKTFEGKYKFPVHLFEFSVPLGFDGKEEVEFTNLTIGGFFKNDNEPTNNFAIFPVNELGEYLSDVPLLNINGKNTYEEVFEMIDYTYIG